MVTGYPEGVRSKTKRRWADARQYLHSHRRSAARWAWSIGRSAADTTRGVFCAMTVSLSLAAASPVGLREALPAELVRPGPRVRLGAQAPQESPRRPDAATRRPAKLFPRQRRRDRRAVPGAQGIRRDGRGAAPVAEVVDEHLAGALRLRHARDVLLRISPHQVLRNVPGETLDVAPVGLRPQRHDDVQALAARRHQQALKTLS